MTHNNGSPSTPTPSRFPRLATFAGPTAAVLMVLPWAVQPCGIGWDNGMHRRAVLGWLDAWQQGVAWPAYIDTPNAGLGSLWPSYYPPLFHVLTALGLAVGLDYWRAALATIGLSQAVGSWLCFHWLQGRTSRPAAALGSVVFALAPYSFLNIYLRGAFPEGFALGWLPGVLLGLDGVRDRWRWRPAVVGSFCLGLIALSNLPALLIAGVAAGLGLALTMAVDTVSAAVRGVLVIALGLALTAFSWLSAWLDNAGVDVVGTDLTTNPSSVHYLRFGTFPADDLLIKELYASGYAIATIAVVLTLVVWFGHPRGVRDCRGVSG